MPSTLSFTRPAVLYAPQGQDPPRVRDSPSGSAAGSKGAAAAVLRRRAASNGLHHRVDDADLGT